MGVICCTHRVRRGECARGACQVIRSGVVVVFGEAPPHHPTPKEYKGTQSPRAPPSGPH
jgi:hypothetical protein